jgi:hypothetical protein
MSAEPVTLLHRSRKGEPWREIGTANGYGAALLLGERAGLRGGHWWFRTRLEREPARPDPEARQPTLFGEAAPV